MQLIIGIFYHMVGASSATLCYTPQKGIKNWSWQTFWVAQALVCWLVLPFVIAWLTIPDLSAVLKEAPSDAMIKSFLLGMAYGVGGTAFGYSIRHLGYSLTYAIAVGISCVLGTLLPPLVNGTLMGILQGQGSGYLFTGIFSGAIGIAFCGVAGRGKEKDLNGMEAQVEGPAHLYCSRSAFSLLRIFTRPGSSHCRSSSPPRCRQFQGQCGLSILKFGSISYHFCVLCLPAY